MASGLQEASGLNFRICLVVLVVAMVVNTIIAEIEHRMPGGFLNPNPESSQRAGRPVKNRYIILRCCRAAQNFFASCDDCFCGAGC